MHQHIADQGARKLVTLHTWSWPNTHTHKHIKHWWHACAPPVRQHCSSHARHILQKCVMHEHRLRWKATADHRPTSSPLVAGQHDALRGRLQIAATDDTRTEAIVIVVIVMMPMLMGAAASNATSAAAVFVFVMIRIGAANGRLKGGRIAGRAAAASRRLAHPMRLGHSLAAKIVVEVVAENAGHAVQCDRIDARIEKAVGVEQDRYL